MFVYDVVLCAACMLVKDIAWLIIRDFVEVLSGTNFAIFEVVYFDFLVKNFHYIIQ